MSWQRISSGFVVARKEHRCIWCGEPIEKGQKMRVDTGKYDEDFQSNKYHPECWEASTEVLGADCDCFDPGMFKRGTTKPK